MNSKSDFNQPENLSELSENINKIQRFESSEMLTCSNCGRTSPPTRVRCFYCNHELPVSDLQRQFFKPKLRQLEEHEKGFNLIAETFSGEITDSLILKAANFLQAEPDFLRLVFEAKKPLPLLRGEFAKDAEVISENLAELGIKSFIVSDEELRLNSFPRRLRSLEFDAEKMIFILFNNDEISEVALEEPLFVICGAVFERRIDSREDLKAKKKKSKNAEITETSTDYSLIDLYPENDWRGFRIESKGFDFSCLESDKSLLVKDNILMLKRRLGAAFSQINFDEDYLRVRPALGSVWAASEKKDAGGIDRSAFSGVKRLNSITINNLQQFNRYSRLQNLMYEKKNQQ